MSTVHIEHATAIDQALAASRPLERVELAEREADGVSVALYWTRGTDVLAVTVDDAASGDSFELVVAEKERPLDVFYHPFAYAHARGSSYSVTNANSQSRSMSDHAPERTSLR